MAEKTSNPRKQRVDAGLQRVRPRQAGKPSGGSRSTNPRMVCRNVNVYYGDKQAIKNVSIDIGRNEVLAMIGPSGCGKSTFIRCLNRMNDTDRRLPRDRGDHPGRDQHLRQERRCGAICGPRWAWCFRSRTRFPNPSTRTSPTGRASTGSPAPRPSWMRRSRPPPEGRPVGRGQGPPGPAGHRNFRRPAAAAVHRADHRGQPGDHPDGRALLGAGPDRHVASSRT